ncbi:MAG TPA: hypothetical protein VN203_03720, partial [Candidatus Acidoferrum sp.]|nr:hypothetical protein [Candidatus Acidoferrum sp.]
VHRLSPIAFHVTLLSSEHWACSTAGWFTVRSTHRVLPDSISPWAITSFRSVLGSPRPVVSNASPSVAVVGRNPQSVRRSPKPPRPKPVLPTGTAARIQPMQD